MKKYSPVNFFCNIALVEGISYVILLGIAMPLKYFMDMPMAVKITGWAHGVLFVAYVASLTYCWIFYRWAFTRVTWYFVASLLPIVPFIVERKLRREYG